MREREVLSLIAAGLPNRDIAKRLILASKTVRNYVSSIFTKLQVADRADAIIEPGKPASPPSASPGDLVPQPIRLDSGSAQPRSQQAQAPSRRQVTAAT